jgi:hypothetical protein
VNRSLYARLADLAGRQHGVVTLHQLVVPGLSRQAVSKRMSAGRLHRAHQGVYAVGHRTLTGHGHRMAAVLAYGPDALLSHLSTLALHGLRPDWLELSSTARAGWVTKASRKRSSVPRSCECSTRYLVIAGRSIEVPLQPAACCRVERWNGWCCRAPLGRRYAQPI